MGTWVFAESICGLGGIVTEDKVKLTIRLPAELHQTLKERAAEYNVSLNQVMVDTLMVELRPESHEETDGQKFDRVLRESGLLVEMGPEWDKLIGDESEIPSAAEMREILRGIPLSDWIVEDRGPR
jgi:plasmid stability protein